MSYKLFPLGMIPTIISGNPATGYKVYSYLAGSSTPQATYTDSTGGTPNANPILFDQYGLKPIWLNTTSLYKLVFKSSDDSVTYLTLDNVEGIASGSSSTSLTLSSITTSSGNSILSFSAVANDINGLTVIDSATGISPTLKGSGADPNVGMKLTGQGSGLVEFPTTFALTGNITPAALASNTNDYAPSGYTTCNVINLSSSSAVNLTGLQGGVTGKVLYLYNSGSNVITLTAADSNSSAANRFNFPLNMPLIPGAGLIIIYMGSNWCQAQTAQFLQKIRTTYSTYNNTSSAVTANAPTSAQGVQIISQNITTKVANSQIDIEFSALVGTAATGSTTVAIFNGSTLLGQCRVSTGASGSTGMANILYNGTLGAIGTYTISVRFGNSGGSTTSYINGDSSSGYSGANSVLTIEERVT